MSPNLKRQAIADINAQLAASERRREDMVSELATLHLAHLSECRAKEAAQAESRALRQIIADLCRTRKPTEFGTYEQSLLWMRARCVADGGGL